MDEFRRQVQLLAERARSWIDLAARWLGHGAASVRRAWARWSDARNAHLARRAQARQAASTPDQRDDEAALVVATGDDDVASIVGRIDIADAPEIVLLVRRDARALRRPTAWAHVAAHVRRRGIELGVVASRGDVRAHARANGLPAARTLRGIRPRREYVELFGRRWEVPPVPWGGLVRAAVALSILGSLVFAACYQLPTATVTILPPSELLMVSGEARANALVESSDLETKTIAASTLRRQVFTAVTTVTTGEVEVGDSHAILEVTFENASATVELVPRGTRLLTEDGIAFSTDEDLDVPAEGRATVSATAELPGETGNVDADALVTVDGDAPSAVTLVDSTAGSGGTNRLTAGVSQDDVDRARLIAREILDRIALGTLERVVAEEKLGTLIPSSVSAAIFSEEPQQQLEEPSDIFVVEYTITASGLLVSDEQADAYGDLLVRADLPPGVALIPGSIATSVTPTDTGDGSVIVSATARATALDGIRGTAAQITGMRPEAARNLLYEELRLEATPEIRIRPGLVPWLWLPRRAENIEVVIGALPTEDAATEDGATGDGDTEEEATDEDSGGTPAAADSGAGG